MKSKLSLENSMVPSASLMYKFEKLKDVICLLCFGVLGSVLSELVGQK